MPLMNTFLLLALVGKWVTATRVSVDDQTLLYLNASSDFVCPAECLECCDSSGALAGIGLGSYSFKCVLRDSGILPASRTCVEASKRSYSSQFKTKCEYDASESKAPGTCSNRHKCCCDEAAGLTRARCFDGRGKNGIVVVWDWAETNQKETFKMRPQQKYEPDGCQKPGDVHQVWDWDAGRALPSATLAPPGKYAQRKGCCTRTEARTVRHKWTATGQRMIGRTPTMTRTPKDQTVTYTVCMEREELYFCSDDNGFSHNGKFVYDSVPKTVEGTCIGDKVPVDGKVLESTGCPEGTVSSKNRDWCQCQENCGNEKSQK